MAGSVRFFRCPKCRRVHSQGRDVPVYKCTGCGDNLRTRRLPEQRKEEDERPPRSENEPVINLESSETPPPENENPSSISVSDDGNTSEVKGSSPPELSPPEQSPPATALAETCSNSGSIASAEDVSGKGDKLNPVSRRTFKANKTITSESSSRNSAMISSEDDLSCLSLSSDNTSNGLTRAPVIQPLNLQIIGDNVARDCQDSPIKSASSETLEDEAGGTWSGGSRYRRGSEMTPSTSQRDRRSGLWRWPLAVEEVPAPPKLEDKEGSSRRGGNHHRRESEISQVTISDRQRDRRYDPWRRSFVAEEAMSPRQLARRGSLEDESGSSRSGESHSRQAAAPPNRRHCRAVAGAAPFVTCSGCEELLQLPVDFELFSGRRKLRCGGCSKILSFWFSATGRLRPAKVSKN